MTHDAQPKARPSQPVVERSAARRAGDTRVGDKRDEAKAVDDKRDPKAGDKRDPKAGDKRDPKGDKREAKPVGDKREAIMDAALELFVERGFFGTAVPEIADKAGVGAGTIYRYFESKEALVNAIYRQEKLKFADLVLDGFPLVSSTREQFRQLWMRMAAFAIEYTNAFIFLELHHHARYLDAESRAVEDRMLALFTGVVTKAQATGDLKPGNPRLLMGLVMGAFTGVIRSCVEIDSRLDSADWKLAEQCIWEAVRA